MPVYILEEDQLEVICECGTKYRVVKQVNYSLEEIHYEEMPEEKSPWEKFSRPNRDSNQYEP
jgi:hypothetical protein